MSKITFISDTHSYHHKVLLEPGDVLVHSGDFTGDEHGMAYARGFLSWLDQQPFTNKILVAGNHDLAWEKYPEDVAMLVESFPSVHYLKNGPLLCIDGISFWGSPHQPEFFDLAFNVPRGPKIAAIWAKIPDGIDVLITHGPPYGHHDTSAYNRFPQEDPHVGCGDLARAVERVKPRVHAFGHVHAGYGTSKLVRPDGSETQFINASVCNGSYRPVNKPITIELKSNHPAA